MCGSSHPCRLLASLHLLAQVLASPYKRVTDNTLATCTNTLLCLLFVCYILFKVGSITELRELRLVLTFDQLRSLEVKTGALTVLTCFTIVGAIPAIGLLLLEQVRQEHAHRVALERIAKARRLRWKADGMEVHLQPPVIPPCKTTGMPPTYVMGAVSGRYHLFLSHARLHRTESLLRESVHLIPTLRFETHAAGVGHGNAKRE